MFDDDVMCDKYDTAAVAWYFRLVEAKKCEKKLFDGSAAFGCTTS